MHSELGKLMYWRNMLKNKYYKDKKNNYNFNQYERHRNRCVNEKGGNKRLFII